MTPPRWGTTTWGARCTSVTWPPGWKAPFVHSFVHDTPFVPCPGFLNSNKLALVWKAQAHGDRPPVRVQSLDSGHVGHSRPHIAQTLQRQALHRHLLLKGVQRHSAVHAGIPVPACPTPYFTHLNVPHACEADRLLGMAGRTVIVFHDSSL